MPAGKSAVLGLVGVVAFAASRIAAAQTVADPLGEAMRSEANDPWVVVKFDWNEDGRDDLLITSKQSIAMAGREGGTHKPRPFPRGGHLPSRLRLTGRRYSRRLRENSRA